jgi:hypothetical protein
MDMDSEKNLIKNNIKIHNEEDRIGNMNSLNLDLINVKKEDFCSFNPLQKFIDESEEYKKSFDGITISDLQAIIKNDYIIRKQIRLKNKAEKYITERKSRKAYKVLSKVKAINIVLENASKYAVNLDENKLIKIHLLEKRLINNVI